MRVKFELTASHAPTCFRNADDAFKHLCWRAKLKRSIFIHKQHLIFSYVTFEFSMKAKHCEVKNSSSIAHTSNHQVHLCFFGSKTHMYWVKMNLIRLTRSYSKVFCLIFLILCVIFLYKLIKGPSSVNEERHDVGLNLEQDELQDGGKLRTLKVSLDDGTLKERIELARDYLLAQIKSNGQFVYKVSLIYYFWRVDFLNKDPQIQVLSLNDNKPLRYTGWLK